MHLLKKTIEKTEDLNKNTGLTILAHALNDSFLINLYNNRLVTSGKPVVPYIPAVLVLIKVNSGIIIKQSNNRARGAGPGSW